MGSGVGPFIASVTVVAEDIDDVALQTNVLTNRLVWRGPSMFKKPISGLRGLMN